MSDLDYINVGLLIIRLALGGMIFAHGWRHLKSVRSGPGIANWFESLGLRNGKLQAWNVTLTELAAGIALVLGLLTPIAYGGLASILLVALVTNHWKNGFFINNPGEGWEYVGITAIVAIGLGALGPGEWSLDNVFDIKFALDPSDGFRIASLIGIVGTALFLAMFWKGPQKAAKS